MFNLPARTVAPHQKHMAWSYVELDETVTKTFYHLSLIFSERERELYISEVANSCFLANVNSCSCSLYVVVRPSVVCLSSVCRLSSVTFVHPTQPIEIFGNVSTPCNTLVTRQHPGKILRRSSQGNPSIGGLNQTVVEKFGDFGPLLGYISETVQDMR